MRFWSDVFLPGFILKLLSLRLRHQISSAPVRRCHRISAVPRSFLLTFPAEDREYDSGRKDMKDMKGMKKEGICSIPSQSHIRIPVLCDMTDIFHERHRKLCALYFARS